MVSLLLLLMPLGCPEFCDRNEQKATTEYLNLLGKGIPFKRSVEGIYASTGGSVFRLVYRHDLCEAGVRCRFWSALSWAHKQDTWFHLGEAARCLIGY